MYFFEKISNLLVPFKGKFSFLFVKGIVMVARLSCRRKTAGNFKTPKKQSTSEGISISIPVQSAVTPQKVKCELGDQIFTFVIAPFMQKYLSI